LTRKTLKALHSTWSHFKYKGLRVKDFDFILKKMPLPWQNHFTSILNNISKFENRQYFQEADYINKSVLDFGGSGGQLAVALLLKGASSATLVDPDISEEIMNNLRRFPGLKIVKGYADKVLSGFKDEYDFIVAHSVTEHIQDLPTAFDAMKLVLKPGGKFFIAHDNYYHASGHHDNLILQIGQDGKYGYQGPKCWESGICAVSSNFRKKLVASATNVWFPYIWSLENELTLRDGNCGNCNFKKRTTPWAHLLYQDEFNEVFKERAFTTGRLNSTLNKVTPFQLKQYLLEAGFEILMWERSFINNEVTDELLLSQDFVTKLDLRTENVFAVVSK
jgi:2-polyprenyl-3-methyl-5-hydroxy-6-metoxy-1,4-benzoquinol methylase